MEGVGARLGRSSTRYGPATVFTGPVRKWKKKWVPVPSPSRNSNAPSSHPGGGADTTTTNTNNSHLLLYKWAPVSSSAAAGKDAAATSAAAAPEEPPRRKFRYVPVSVIEEQKQEDAAKTDDETKPSDADPSPRPIQSDGSDEKPDVNDIPMEEAQDQTAQQEANETNLDLSLGLKSHDGERGADRKMMDRSEGLGRLGRAVSGEDLEMKSATNSEVDNRTKRKVVAPDLEMRV